MGFGLLIIGYISVLGFFPDLFIYYNFGIYIAVAGGLIMLAAFIKLQEYNVFFRIMKYICIAYILILLGFTPFVIIKHSDIVRNNFMIVSKIIRIFFLFIFQYFLLSGIATLAKSIDNIKVLRSAKRTVYVTYIFFAMTVLEIFDIFDENYIIVMLCFGLIYYIMTLTVLFGCYMRITYEGHDEEENEKFEKIQSRFKINTLNKK